MVEIEWVNHSSFIYDDGDVRVMCDPWLDGAIFNDGWKLFAPTAFRYEDFATVTHIWISHEHADHFVPANLKRIAPEHRARITVLYHNARDQRVVEWLRAHGFKDAIELPERWYRLSARTDIFCGVFRDPTTYDSFLALRSGGVTTLNLNDPLPHGEYDYDMIAAHVGTIDLLLAQFSFACWTGNPDQVAVRREFADTVRRRFMRHIEKWKPRWVIPSAAFSYFANEDNSFLNSEASDVADIARSIERAGVAEPVVLFPGDHWKIGAPHDNSTPLRRYRDAWERATGGGFIRSRTVPMEDLIRQGAAFAETLREKNSPLLLGLLRPCRIYVTDLARAVTFSALRGVREATISPEQCDVTMHSDSLSNNFRNLFGGDALNINGRFTKPPRGRFSRYRIYFAIAALNNIHGRFDLAWVLANIKVVVGKYFDYRSQDATARSK